MDAQKLIAELRGHGFTQSALAAELGIAQSTVCAYEQGTRGAKRGIPWEVANRLIALHEEHVVRGGREAA